MAFTELRFKAGINKEITPYSEENGWVDCDKVRFRFGYPEKLNGWEKNTTNSFLGKARGLHEWVALSGETFLGLGTQLKYYIKEGAGFNDITPIRLTTSAGDVTFSATNGSSTITVTDINHGAVVNDFVTFSGAVSLGGNITAAILNQEYQITNVIDGNTYEISARTVSTISSITDAGEIDDTPVNANSSDTGNGGSSVVGTYQQGTGLNSAVAGTGWGAGLFGGTNNSAFQTTIAEDLDATEKDVTLAASQISNFEVDDVVLVNSELMTVTDTFLVTVADPGSGNAYYINGSLQATVSLVEGRTYKFDQSDISNSGHPLRFSTTSDGTHGGGSEYTTGVTTVGTPGTAGAYTQIVVASSAPTLYYYCSVHSGMGGTANTPTDGPLIVDRGAKGTTATTHTNGDDLFLVDGNTNSADNYNGWGEGVATGTQTSTTNLRVWSHDNFGEDLIFNERNGQIFYWDKTNGVETRGVELSTLTGTPRSVPQKAAQVLLSDRDRHVIAFGSDGLGASSDTQGNGTQDPMLIRFSSQENPIDWYPTDTNTAGDLRIDTGSKIMQAVETRQQIAVFTDTAVYAMQFIGPPFTFGINLVSSNITIASPRAAVGVNDIVYWMGNAEFYSYSGAVQRIPCTVRDYVFNDFNTSQIEKVIAGSNVSFAEVWWFYPSASSEENDRYVVYNYQEGIWYIGTLDRTSWLDRGIGQLPIATSNDSYLFNHETGAKADGQPMTSYIESGDMGVSDGNNFSFISRVIPDLNFRETNVDDTTVDFIFSAKNAPGQVAQSTNTDTVTKTSNTPVDQYTNQYQTRLRGRSFTFKVQSTDKDVLWRLGIPRIDIRQDGRR